MGRDIDFFYCLNLTKLNLKAYSSLFVTIFCFLRAFLSNKKDLNLQSIKNDAIKNNVIVSSSRLPV